MSIKVALIGADGSMGQHITELGIEDPAIDFISAFTIEDSPNLGKDLGMLVGKPKLNVSLQKVALLEENFKNNPPDIAIDFTVAKGTEKNAPIAINAQVPIVIGTTGMDYTFYFELERQCKKIGKSAILATNMATGVNIFFKMAAEIAKHVKGWDIEVIEAHHHRKRDAPSGTAMTTAQKIAKILDQDLEEVAKYGRQKGPNPRKIGKEEIGIHSIRAGDIVGDHTVLYAGDGERIELVHRAHSRNCFASGALKAVKYLHKNRNTGKVYDMQDVLGLK